MTSGVSKNRIVNTRGCTNENDRHHRANPDRGHASVAGPERAVAPRGQPAAQVHRATIDRKHSPVAVYRASLWTPVAGQPAAADWPLECTGSGAARSHRSQHRLLPCVYGAGQPAVRGAAGARRIACDLELPSLLQIKTYLAIRRPYLTGFARIL